MDIRNMHEKSKMILTFWKEYCYWAPNNVAEKLKIARIDWLIDLIDCLQIWTEKAPALTDGELILAYANLGCLVEGFLKLFYCVYYNDYIENVLRGKTESIDKKYEPNNLRFESLKQLGRKTIWNSNTNNHWNLWIDTIQRKRNAIHGFNNIKIGNSLQFMINIKKFGDFVELMNERLPYPDECTYLSQR